MKMIAKKLTIDEMRNCEGKNYNPTEWSKNIDGMLKYSDVEFYHVTKGNGYDYERYFVEYTLPEGLRLFTSFSYGGSLTNGGFYRLDKIALTEKGKTMADVLELIELNKKEELNVLVKELAETKLFQISYGKFIDADGNECLYNTTKEARKRMSQLSINNHMTFTKG